MGSMPELPIRSTTEAPAVETDILIVGAGPAGASLACFLARYGITGIMISAQPGTSDTPRAHVHNMAAMNCLRDIGLWEECKKLGHGGSTINNYRWCESMAGEEYGRNLAWGENDRKSDYEMVSPCHHIDLPQSLLEPILVKYATVNGFKLRFDTELLSFTEDKTLGKITCLVQDLVTRNQYQIVTKYLFGADGGRSRIVKQLGLPMTVVPGGGLAFNILARVDLTHLMEHKKGGLHWCLRLKKDHPWMCVTRMVKPWSEWMFVVLPKNPLGPIIEPTKEEWADYVLDIIDDKNVKGLEIVRVDKWMINETSADVISNGNVFCMGDSIHRHPPTLGLGSNTGMQESFNLAWKVNLVLKGLASPSLLDSYNTERQPVGARLVTRSNEILRSHIEIWQALGVQPPGSTDEQRLATIIAMKSHTAEGKEKRRFFKEKVEYMHHETHALGTEFGQTYTSNAIYTFDEPEPFTPQGREAQNDQLYYEPCTYPGRRLPHVWLNTEMPGNLVSTIDVAGKGRFCLITGFNNQWNSAVETVQKELGVPIKAVSIGRGQDWEDIYFHWENIRSVEEDGAVLVRPDLYVAWRAKTGGNEAERLGKVMKYILGLEK